MEHFYHCKSLWINHDYERTPMCMWACAHACLATPRCFFLAAQPLLNGPHHPTSRPFYRVFSCCHRARLPRAAIDFFFSPPIHHPLCLSFCFFFGAVTFKMKSFIKELLVPSQWKEPAEEWHGGINAIGLVQRSPKVSLLHFMDRPSRS